MAAHKLQFKYYYDADMALEGFALTVACADHLDK